MRWDNLRVQDDDGSSAATSAPATLALFGRDAVARTFDAPGFRGMTFYEVHAKSIINRVPEASRLPFRWTINPYRGCSHSCAYCLGAQTAILMADGRTRPLAEIRAGDQVCGTVRTRNARRCVRTEVLAHWSVIKPAYRVTLRDGTRLICSGDHRFLTGRGWKYVTGAEQGPPERPHLTRSDALMGVGAGQSDADRRVASVEPLGMDVQMYDITTGTGDFIADGVVSHNCFARNTHTYLDMDAGHDFNTQIVVKLNAPELARRELASGRWHGDHVAMGTNVDCYQRAEGRYRLMPGIIGALRDAANPFSILTKGTLILRDLDLLCEAAEMTEVGLNVSVGFIDKAISRSVEPGTPSPERRLGVCAALTARGLRCGVLMGPVLPFLTDSPEQLETTVRLAAEAGAAHVSPIVLHLRPGARQWFLRWLTQTHPDLVGPYRELYGRGAYLPKAYQQRITDQVAAFAARYRVGQASPGQARQVRRQPARPAAGRPPGEQLTLL